MVMIRHETVGMTNEESVLLNRGENIEEILVVFIFPENQALFESARVSVIIRPRVFYA